MCGESRNPILPTKYGDFRMIAYSSDVDHEMHVALVRGDLGINPPGDARRGEPAARPRPFALPDGRCAWLNRVRLPRDDRRDRWRRLPQRTAEFLSICITRGADFELIRGRKKTHALPQILYHERGHVERDPGVQRVIQHESGIGAQILNDLGLRRIRVLTNLPRKVVALKGYGIEIADQVPLGDQDAKQSHQLL